VGERRSVTGLRQVGHLVTRFFTSLATSGPDPDHERWFVGLLESGERELYESMTAADRGHAVIGARFVADHADDDGIGDRDLTTVAVAAGLHDVGKTVAALGTFGRVAATLATAIAGRRRVSSWATDHDARAPSGRIGRMGRMSWGDRIGRYADHSDLGATMLRSAGSEDLVVAWAAEHHLDRSDWTIDPDLGSLLWRADRAHRAHRASPAHGEGPRL